jgi:hypothetical protein
MTPISPSITGIASLKAQLPLHISLLLKKLATTQ